MVELPTPHDDYEFAIWTADLEVMMISFKRGRKDTVAPVVAADVLRNETQIELVAS